MSILSFPFHLLEYHPRSVDRTKYIRPQHFIPTSLPWLNAPRMPESREKTWPRGNRASSATCIAAWYHSRQNGHTTLSCQHPPHAQDLGIELQASFRVPDAVHLQNKRARELKSHSQQRQHPSAMDAHSFPSQSVAARTPSSPGPLPPRARGCLPRTP